MYKILFVLYIFQKPNKGGIYERQKTLFYDSFARAHVHMRAYQFYRNRVQTRRARKDGGARNGRLLL